MTTLTERSICIHGHFYQPPRENPWLEYLESQPSAHPFHDWNERIAEECYTPNAEARILDQQGRLGDVVCNYEHISFDFGPTLLSWIEEHVPETYRAILKADEVSAARRSGHGNAMAQAYNHLIMPLAITRDKITQIIWGIKDFRSRFRRDPEGMWLPETAVDLETLSLLADNGISFTVLSPYQCSKFPISPALPWTQTTPGSVDPSRPYLCKLPRGNSIAIFFYDAPISQAIAFEGLLNSGDEFKNRLLEGFSDDRQWPQLVNIATDGESYGHHHRFGEMALAYAIEKLLELPGVRLTNYAEFLAEHPPSAEVEIIENSSWSCAHGVGRWCRDCGCSTGQKPGWNQKWRSALRKAMDTVRQRADDLFVKKAGAIFSDPWSVRDEYIAVILEKHRNSEGFVKQHVTDPSPETVLLALKLLEMQRNRMLMYTSCGWFFEDISGLESLQVMRYAARVIQLAADDDPGLIDDFLEELSYAVSNVKPQATGAEIFTQRILPQIADLDHVAAHVAILSGFEDVPIQRQLYCYDIQMEDLSRNQSADRVLLVGRMSVRSQITSDAGEFLSAVIYLGDVDLRCSVGPFKGQHEYQALKQDLVAAFNRRSSTELIRKLDAQFPGRYFSMKNLFAEERIRIIEAATTKMYEEQAGLFEVFYKKNKDLAIVIVDHEAPLPDTFLAAATFVLNRTFLGELEKLARGYYPDEMESVLEEARFWKIKPDTSSASKLIGNRIMALLRDLQKMPGDEKIPMEILRFLDLGKNLELELQLGKAQILFLRIARTVKINSWESYPKFFPELAERLSVRLKN